VIKMKKSGGGERENWDLTTKDTKKHEGIGTRVAIAFPEHLFLAPGVFTRQDGFDPRLISDIPPG